MSTRAERQADKSQNELNLKVLKTIMQRPDNRKCADCRKNDPRWASWNLGVFVCIRCSGFHRSLGTHISKVRSADLDIWTQEQVISMVKWGNSKANIYWEHDLPKDFMPPEQKMEQFVRAKYERKQYTQKKDLPDPHSIPLPSGISDVQLPSPFNEYQSSPQPAAVTAAHPPNNNQITDSVTNSLLNMDSVPQKATEPAKISSFANDILSLYSSNSQPRKNSNFTSQTNNSAFNANSSHQSMHSNPSSAATSFPVNVSGSGNALGSVSSNILQNRKSINPLSNAPVNSHIHAAPSPSQNGIPSFFDFSTSQSITVGPSSTLVPSSTLGQTTTLGQTSTSYGMGTSGLLNGFIVNDSGKKTMDITLPIQPFVNSTVGAVDPWSSDASQSQQPQANQDIWGDFQS